MPRRAGQLPEFKLHKSTGHAFVYLEGRQVFLGRHGSPEATAEYDRLVAEWLSRGRPKAPVRVRTGGVTVAEVAATFLAHADAYYRSASGEPTGEAENFVHALAPALKLYRRLAAAEFTQEHLEAVRSRMIESGLSRSTINARVNRIRRVWRWAASKRRVPASVHAELCTLGPLLRNRTKAREAPGVEPVSVEVLEATLPHMPASVAAMVRVQLLTGCRFGEVVRMRGDEIDRTRDRWEYRPGEHKTEHKGRRRMIPLGPRCRYVLEPFLSKAGGGWLFVPREASASRDVRPHYDRRSYAQAVRRACDRAFPHPVLSKIKTSRTTRLTEEQRTELAAWRKAHRWTPLQIRHAVGTAVRRERGLEAAQAVLGHARADVTQIYAERLDEAARDVARSMG